MECTTKKTLKNNLYLVLLCVEEMKYFKYFVSNCTLIRDSRERAGKEESDGSLLENCDAVFSLNVKSPSLNHCTFTLVEYFNFTLLYTSQSQTLYLFTASKLLWSYFMKQFITCDTLDSTI